MVVINWMGDANDVEFFLLKPIFEELNSFESFVAHATFHHVNREINEFENGFLKAQDNVINGSLRMTIKQHMTINALFNAFPCQLLSLVLF